MAPMIRPLLYTATLAALAMLVGQALAAPTISRLTPPSELFASGRPAPVVARFLPGQRFVIVPRITELITGIYATRKHLKGCYFDAEACKHGVARIEGYKKRFNRADNRFVDEPDKSNGCSEGADALRQWAQAKELGMVEAATTPGTSGGRSDYREAEAPDWRM